MNCSAMAADLDPLVDEGDALRELLVGIDDRGLRDAEGPVHVQALDDQRQRKARRALHLAAHREDGEGRRRDPAVMHQRLGQILAARQDQAARIAPGIGDLHQLEIAGDVLVVGDVVVEFLQQREDHVRLEFFDRLADRLDLVLRTEGANLVAGRAQGAHHVVFRLPRVDFLRRVSVGGVRRHEVRMHQHQNA